MLQLPRPAGRLVEGAEGTESNPIILNGPSQVGFESFLRWCRHVYVVALIALRLSSVLHRNALAHGALGQRL